MTVANIPEKRFWRKQKKKDQSNQLNYKMSDSQI